MTPDQILDRTAAYFGRPVRKLTAPGGRSRESFRAWFDEGTVIVSHRQHSAAAVLEARILAVLSPLTDHIPRLLGQDGPLIFQEDAGQDRLNWLIHTLPPAERPALADKAIAALLQLHRAASHTDIAQSLSPSGLRVLPGDDLFLGAARFAAQLKRPDCTLSPDRFSSWFHLPPARFTKCDCRAGNAALDPNGHLRWFDFEDARLGHGPEDFAWLIADETWPLPADTMLSLIAAQLTRQDTPDSAAWLAYLQEYTCLQAIRRLRFILSQAKRKGWVDKVTILKYDRAGTNPYMAEHLAQRGAALSRLAASTQRLVPLFDQAADLFRRVRAPAAGDIAD